MTSKHKGALVLGIHLACIAALAAKYAYDRATLPRAWAKVDVTAPVEGDVQGKDGRYLALRVCPLNTPSIDAHTSSVRIRLKAVNGQLTAQPGTDRDRLSVMRSLGEKVCLVDSVYLFLPETISLPPSSTDLWAEFSVPDNELPRPLRFGTMENGRIEELKR